MGVPWARIGADVLTGGLAEAPNAISGGGDWAGDAADSVGGAVKDFQTAGINPNTYQQYHVEAPSNGMDASTAWDMMGNNKGDIAASRGGQDWAIAQGQNAQSRGPQAWEDQGLSNQEAGSRGYQSDALGLAQNAAYGNAPSVAAYQMQHGLDQALAQQTAMAGSARGGAALATAQGNAAGNVANLEQNTFTGAGMLRAQEMAQARDQYGNLATGQRGQDQNRLQQGNQMAQFNAGLNDQYALGMGGLGVAYGGLTNSQQQTNQGYFNTGVGINNSNAGYQQGANDINAQSYGQTQAVNAGVGQANTDARRAMNDRVWNTVMGAPQIAGGMMPGKGGGMGGTNPNA